MLIRRATLLGGEFTDVRVANGIIEAIGQIEPQANEQIIDAQGGALLPGLHDHHIHLAAASVRRQSVVCGPPEVSSRDALQARLAAAPGNGWIRGILYHESLMGLPDAGELDLLVPDRPLRIQHRSGRMWLLNTLAMDTLLALGDPPPGLERQGNGFTGRLFDEDSWLRRTLGALPPDFSEVSNELAQFGVTGLTDMSPSNDRDTRTHFESERERGHLAQRYLLAGTLDLGRGPAKLHLHENALPDFDECLDFARRAHAMTRPLAVHCTTETEIVFALAILESAGAMCGDRIEHAGIATDEHIARIAKLGLAVVSQPHFIAERGDQYITDVEPGQVPILYRLASFRQAGVPLAGGSDAPFGALDPWAAMRAAVSRLTASGKSIGLDEVLNPDEALALYLADPDDLSKIRHIRPGVPANLCLLDRPWDRARNRLSASDVRATLIGGNLVHEAPFESNTR